MNDISRAVLPFLIIKLVNSTIHWSLHVLYSMWCAPHTVKGLLTSFFTLGSPLCQFINYIQFELAKHKKTARIKELSILRTIGSQKAWRRGLKSSKQGGRKKRRKTRRKRRKSLKKRKKKKTRRKHH